MLPSTRPLPGSVWATALFIFLAIALAKKVGVVREDGWAAGANAVLAIISGGGFATLTELSAALEVSAVSVLAAFYYILWDRWVAQWVEDGWDWFKGLFKKKI